MTREIAIKQLLKSLPKRPADGHKGTFGHLVVAAGSRGFSGAALLACRAAHRTGVGLVTLALPEPLVDTLAPALIETMALPLPATDVVTFSAAAADPLLAFAHDREAMVIGPGLSQRAQIGEFVRQVLARYAGPMVIDADALNAIARKPGEALAGNPGPRILTPHPGEMARLAGITVAEVQTAREGTAQSIADAYGCIVCLKGAGTIIAAPGEKAVRNSTGNPGMGTGGTGDVLAGILGGLLAQGIPPFQATQLGVYLHGVAGDFAADEATQRGMTASDIITMLPAAWRSFETAP